MDAILLPTLKADIVFSHLRHSRRAFWGWAFTFVYLFLCVSAIWYLTVCRFFYRDTITVDRFYDRWTWEMLTGMYAWIRSARRLLWRSGEPDQEIWTWFRIQEGLTFLLGIVALAKHCAPQSYLAHATVGFMKGSTTQLQPLPYLLSHWKMSKGLKMWDLLLATLVVVYIKLCPQFNCRVSWRCDTWNIQQNQGHRRETWQIRSGPMCWGLLRSSKRGLRKWRTDWTLGREDWGWISSDKLPNRT